MVSFKREISKEKQDLEIIINEVESFLLTINTDPKLIRKNSALIFQAYEILLLNSQNFTVDKLELVITDRGKSELIFFLNNDSFNMIKKVMGDESVPPNKLSLSLYDSLLSKVNWLKKSSFIKMELSNSKCYILSLNIKRE